MSLEDKIEEAEAVLDSAEMLLETFPGHSSTAKDLDTKITELEQVIQDPDSEREIKDLIEEIKELMEQLEDEGMKEPAMGPEEGAVGGPGGFDEPGDDMPPI